MIIATLKTLGPCLSTELTDYLVKQHRLKPDAARQRVSRAPAQVKRLAHLPFARKARFLYLQEQYASANYWHALRRAIYASKGAYARALGAVDARGIVPLEHFPIVSGAPVAQKKHISATTVLQRLIDASVLVKTELPGFGPCVMTKESYDSTEFPTSTYVAQARARQIGESILLDATKEWLRRLGIVSFNSVRSRSDQASPPMVGTFAWDLTGPSYLAALVTQSGKQLKPGIAVVDVLLRTKEVRLEHVEPFLYKVASLQALRKVGKTLFFFVANRYEPDAFRALRSAGIVPATPETLFGKDAADAFSELISTLTRAALGSLDPVKFNELFERLGKLEGAVGNMRGAFFELLVAEVVRKRSPAEVELNKICKGDDGKAEVDIWEVKPGIVARFIECKGNAPDSIVSHDEIKLWLDTRINRVRQHFARTSSWNGPLPRFELWTTGILSDESLEKIERTRSANASKFQIVVKGPNEIRAEFASINDPSLLRTIENHFLPPASQVVVYPRNRSDGSGNPAL